MSLPDQNTRIARAGNGYPLQPMMSPVIRPVITVTRRVDGLYDIINDGINPSLAMYNFKLSDVPNYTEFTALFQTYRIDAVNITFRPEYTTLSDAAPISNAINTTFNSAVAIDTVTPASVAAVLECSNCSSTSITREHRVSLRPQLLMNNTMPCSCALTTLSPSVQWFGLKIGVPPCGVAMTFRSTVVYKFTFMGMK